MRDYRLDNAKGALIFLVVLGHFIESIKGWDTSSLRYVHTLIYTFHMPAFVFLAGITASQNRVHRRVCILAIILVVFNLAYVLPIVANTGVWPDAILQPHWILWFLLSLIWWQVMLPYLVKIKYSVALTMVAALAVGVLPINGYILSIFRTFTFLPFFLTGHLYGKKILESVNGNWISKLAAFAIIAEIGWSFYAAGTSAHWFYGSFGYSHFKVDAAKGSLMRAILTIAASVSLVCFIYILPSRASLLSRVGQSSLAIFLLHGFAIKYGRTYISMFHEQYGDINSIALALIATSIIVAIFSISYWSRFIKSGAELLIDIPKSIFHKSTL